MQHLKNCLIKNTPKARETRISKLNQIFLIDKHNKEFLYENKYIKNISF